MSRAKWKNIYVPKKLLINFLKKKHLSNSSIEFKTKLRSSSIIPCFVGNFFLIHNGKTFYKIQITENMIGKKLGEFAPTRKIFSFKKKKLK